MTLGLMCEQGQGVAKDAVEAARWYRKAAGQGNAEAQQKLGFMWRIQEMIGWRFFLVLAGISGGTLLVWKRLKPATRRREDEHSLAPGGQSDG